MQILPNLRSARIKRTLSHTVILLQSINDVASASIAVTLRRFGIQWTWESWIHRWKLMVALISLGAMCNRRSFSFKLSIQLTAVAYHDRGRFIICLTRDNELIVPINELSPPASSIIHLSKVSRTFTTIFSNGHHAVFLAHLASVYVLPFWIEFRTRQEIFGVPAAEQRSADQSAGNISLYIYIYIVVSILESSLQSNLYV